MKRMISEDQKIYDVQRQMMGMKNQSDPQANSVSTFVNANNQDNSKAPVNRPYPLGYHEAILSNMYLDMLNYKKMVANAYVNPALKPEFKQLLDSIDNKVNAINDTLVEIDRIMSNIM